MEHTKGILLECNLSEEEINTVIEALSRDYVENDAEILEKEYQLQGKLREIISTFYTKIDAQKFTQMQVFGNYITKRMFDFYHVTRTG